MRLSKYIGVLFLALALGLMLTALATNLVAKTVAFFCGGSAMLVACLAAVRVALYAQPGSGRPRGESPSLLRLGLRNALRNPGRSQLTVALIACATFIIASLGAFRLEVDDDG